MSTVTKLLRRVWARARAEYLEERLRSASRKRTKLTRRSARWTAEYDALQAELAGRVDKATTIRAGSVMARPR